MSCFQEKSSANRGTRMRADNRKSIGIIGLGYVGLPLAIEFCRHGFEVFGIDKSAEKIEQLRRGKSYIGDVSDADVEDV